MASHGADGVESGLAATPTFFIVLIIALIVLVSIAIERGVHSVGHLLERSKAGELLAAFKKLKEEMLLLGFVSLLIVILEESLITLCVPFSDAYEDWAFCGVFPEAPPTAPTTVPAEEPGGRGLSGRRPHKQCKAGDVPFVSPEALHQIHLLVWMLAVIHIGYSCLTMFFASFRVRTWAAWESDALAALHSPQLRDADSEQASMVQATSFSRHHQPPAYHRLNVPSWMKLALDWAGCFVRQFAVSLRRSDFLVLRQAFISKHELRPGFNFHKYILRCIEEDFAHVLGLNWALWLLVIVYIIFDGPMLYVAIWLPGVTYLAIVLLGAKQLRIVQVLARDIHRASGDASEFVSAVRPHDTLFWFNKPQVILWVVHLILFVNSFTITLALFFLWQSGPDSCYFEYRVELWPHVALALLIIIFVAWQILPVYAVVSQMGSHYKESIFSEHVRGAVKMLAKQMRRHPSIRGGGEGTSSGGGGSLHGGKGTSSGGGGSFHGGDGTLSGGTWHGQEVGSSYAAGGSSVHGGEGRPYGGRGSAHRQGPSSSGGEGRPYTGEGRSYRGDGGSYGGGVGSLVGSRTVQGAEGVWSEVEGGLLEGEGWIRRGEGRGGEGEGSLQEVEGTLDDGRGRLAGGEGSFQTGGEGSRQGERGSRGGRGPIT